MYRLLYFCIVLVFKSSHCRFVPNSEPFNLQRYASNSQSYQIDGSSLKNIQAPDNLQRYHAPQRGERTAQEPLGIVYDNGKPIGFLQPYGNVYQITSEELSSQPNKREYADSLYPLSKQPVEQDDNAEAIAFNEQQTASKFNSEYPAVLTNFKIDSRLKKMEPPMKREFLKEYTKVSKREVGITKQNVDRLKDTLLNYEETPENKAKVQEILGEMGFAELERNNLQKRENLEEEDEDMESGVNAIHLIKDNHEVEKRRSKKTSKQKPAREEENEVHFSDGEEEVDDEQKREKRNDNITQSQNSELMKNLEKSGELTVSGNKSPLASSGETPKTDKQNDMEVQSESEEERVAREIQAKIDAIKDQVKRQIAETREKSDRKKRDVHNLLKEETVKIDPQYNTEEDGEPHHVRRKRDAETPPKGNTTSQERQKRDLNIPLSPYREENEELDEEDDEFEDDGFFDRTAELSARKHPYYRQSGVANGLEWENSLLYDNVNNGLVRKKRHNSEQKPIAIEHLNAIKERSEMPKDYPKNDEEGLKGAQDKLQQIAEMSDADLFGALPEGYEGELARYKRVKKDLQKTKSVD